MRLHQFHCYYRKHNFLTMLKLKSNKEGDIDVMNFEPSTEFFSMEFLPSEAFSIYNVYINIPITNHIKEIERLWQENEFHLTYQNLLELIDLRQIDVILVAETNPDYKDDAVIHLFQKPPKNNQLIKDENEE